MEQHRPEEGRANSGRAPAAADVYVALGGNIGDVLSNFHAALAGIEAGGVEVVRVSSAFRTAALTLPGDTEAQPDYWNAVCHGRTSLSPHELLALLQRLESRAGRVRRRRFEPRPLDLDLLLYGNEVVAEPELMVPHPGLTDRAFVLQPLAEIAPEVCVPPGGVTARELLVSLPDPAEGVLARSASW